MLVGPPPGAGAAGGASGAATLHAVVRLLAAGLLWVAGESCVLHAGLLLSAWCGVNATERLLHSDPMQFGCAGQSRTQQGVMWKLRAGKLLIQEASLQEQLMQDTQHRRAQTIQ